MNQRRFTTTLFLHYRQRVLPLASALALATTLPTLAVAYEEASGIAYALAATTRNFAETTVNIPPQHETTTSLAAPKNVPDATQIPSVAKKANEECKRLTRARQSPSHGLHRPAPYGYHGRASLLRERILR